MKELIRDTAFGHLVRLLSTGKYLKFAEEEDATIWSRYIDQKRLDDLATEAGTDYPEGYEARRLARWQTQKNEFSIWPPSRLRTKSPSGRSSKTKSTNGGESNGSSRHSQDETEKGKDHQLVSWYSENDPENVSRIVVIVKRQDII